MTEDPPARDLANPSANPPAKRSAQLGLVARDADDLTVISALLQDAVLTPGSMAYLPKENAFALVASRFCWENHTQEIDQPDNAAETGGAAGERVMAGLRFDNVRRLQFKGMDIEGTKIKDSFLALLSIDFSGEMVTLNFSGGRGVRITVNSLSCSLKDLGIPWPTQWRPRHDPPEII